MLARQAGAVRNIPAMVRALAVFDPAGTGYITVSTLRDIFERIGELAPTPPEIMDDMVAFADPEETGQVYYEPFVARMFAEYEAAKKAKEAGAGKK
jgi:Ca2+-binding EF-hand superfamily protein